MAVTVHSMKRYTYNTYPKTVYYQSEDTTAGSHCNVMHDKRVVRGNTWALRRMAQEQYKAESIAGRNELRKKRNLIRQQVEVKLKNSKAILFKAKTDSIAGLESENILDQNESNHLDDIEEEKPASSALEAESQTETARSIDAGTQASQEFDSNVEGVVEMLVGSVMEEAMREMLDEEELHRLRMEQESLSMAHLLDQAKIQQLETRVKRTDEEKGIILEELEKAKREEAKLVSRQMAADCVQEMIPETLQRLSSVGLLNNKRSIAIDTKEMLEEIELDNSIKNDVMGDFLPWLYGAANRIVLHEHMQSLLSDVFNCLDKRCQANARKALQKHLKHIPDKLSMITEPKQKDA